MIVWRKTSTLSTSAMISSVLRSTSGVMVVARNDVAERQEPLFDALERDIIRKRVVQVLQLLVRRGRGHEEPLAVARGETADDAGAADGGMH